MTILRDANVLITGAASGIGRLLAEKMSDRGARLILWDIDADGLRELAAGLKQLERQAVVYRVDVSDRQAIARAAEHVLATHGPIDVLINNAGIVTGQPILEASDEQIERTFGVNILAHFWTVRAFLPTMAERNRGHIVTIASAGGLVAAPRLSDYSATKFAAVGFDE
ncbi:MAG TPA: SDR family NAD(P)-dependent oxidoreductase, partial [Gemmatimonadota bacterium]|nr:SDR family NAD(P)-dependent oxidoreductase [Gemmatimonadota bacterium]